LNGWSSRCVNIYNVLTESARYVKEKKARALEDCSTRLEQCDIQLSELQNQIEICREVISSIDKEINESGATISNLRDNIIVQKLNIDIAKIQSEIESYDMEEAAKARRNYEDKYEPAKRREDKLSEVVSLPPTFHRRTNRSLVPSTYWRAWRSESSVEVPRK